ncbi:MAG: hypothetical protein AAB463_00070 [Patescibacteria group bacterium]
MPAPVRGSKPRAPGADSDGVGGGDLDFLLDRAPEDGIQQLRLILHAVELSLLPLTLEVGTAFTALESRSHGAHHHRLEDALELLASVFDDDVEPEEPGRQLPDDDFAFLLRWEQVVGYFPDRPHGFVELFQEQGNPGSWDHMCSLLIDLVIEVSHTVH